MEEQLELFEWDVLHKNDWKKNYNFYPTFYQVKQSVYMCPKCGRTLKHPVVSNCYPNRTCVHSDAAYQMMYVTTI